MSMDRNFQQLLEVVLEPETPQGPYLMVMNGPEDGRIFSIDQDRMDIGRLPANEVSLRLDPTVSRLHARLTRESGSFFLEDQQSMHGTELDGVKITGKTALTPGCLIQVGETCLRFFRESRPDLP